MTTQLYRPVCDLLGCAYPIVLAGMGGVARAELVTAVSEAGGFGFLGMVREPPSLICSEVAALRGRGTARFGVNLIPAATEPSLLDAQVSTCIELGVAVVGLFWDVRQELVARLRAAGILVVCQVGSITEAREAEEAGAQVLIAQGVEAGGHVRGNQRLHDLVPEIVATTELPVLAAGGLTDGADLATMLSLGAQGAVFGTALIATPESFAHDYHKQRLIDANDTDTVLTDAFHINWPPGAKVRVLNNSVTRGERGDPFSGPSTIIGEEAGRPVYLFSTDSPLRSTRGTFEQMALYAGLGVGQVTGILPAKSRVRTIVTEASRLLSATTEPSAAPIELASPACLASEMDDLYMGFSDPDDLVAALNELLEAERAGARATLATAKNIGDVRLITLLMAIHRDEARWCGVLANAINRLQGKPSLKIGAFYTKIMAIDDLAERLAFLNRGQDWVVRKLTKILPTIRNEIIHTALVAMRTSHEQNISLVNSELPVATDLDQSG